MIQLYQATAARSDTDPYWKLRALAVAEALAWATQDEQVAAVARSLTDPDRQEQALVAVAENGHVWRPMTIAAAGHRPRGSVRRRLLFRERCAFPFRRSQQHEATNQISAEDFIYRLQCRTWINRPAGTTSQPESPAMMAIPGPGNLRDCSQPGSVEQERQRRQRAHGRGDHLRSQRRRARPAVRGSRRPGHRRHALRAENRVRSPSR